MASVGRFNTTTGYSRGGLRIVYCSGASHPLKFVASRFLSSNDVEVTRPDATTTHIETQIGEDNNVGLCGRYDTSWDGNSQTETPLVLLLHLDFAYDVKDKQ